MQALDSVRSQPVEGVEGGAAHCVVPLAESRAGWKVGALWRPPGSLGQGTLGRSGWGCELANHVTSLLLVVIQVGYYGQLAGDVAGVESVGVACIGLPVVTTLAMGLRKGWARVVLEDAQSILW